MTISLRNSLRTILLIGLLVGAGCSGTSNVKPPSDQKFLQGLMEETWACLDAMVEQSTGLPRDTQNPGGGTNTTNIGLYLASLCVAKQTNLITPQAAYARADHILRSLESFPRVKGFIPNCIPVDLKTTASHGVMAISDFNKLAAGLILTRQSFPKLHKRITAFLDAIQWNHLYDTKTKTTYWGFNLDTSKPVGGGALMLASDTRLATFMLVATDTAPPTIWPLLRRAPMDTSAGTILTPGYLWGGLFMHAMGGVFLPEADTEVGESAGNLAWHQIQHARKHGYPLWGWANCYIPASGYTQGGYLPERVVAPYAVALTLDYYPRHATAALREMARRRNATESARRWGLSDSYDMANGQWDSRYLSLDQGMMFLALANHLHDGIVRKLYMRDPLIQRGLAKLKPFIQRRPELLERWRKRDAILTDFSTTSARAGKLTRTSVPLTNWKPADKQLTITPGKNATQISYAAADSDTNIANATLQFKPIDLSFPVHLELDIDASSTQPGPIGDLRVILLDRFDQERFATITLDPATHRYSISSGDLYGIWLDETAVNRIRLQFWRAPWFYENRKLRTTQCTLTIKAIRLVYYNRLK